MPSGAHNVRFIYYTKYLKHIFENDSVIDYKCVG